jgi:hypothetical protein
MKSLLIGMSMLMMGSAFAGEITIFDKSWYEIGYNVTVSQEFVVNEEMGRAWIEFSVNDSDPEAPSTEFRTKVDGLSFDANTSAIVIDHEGQIVTCANIVTKGRSVFRTRVVKPTGRCTFKGEWRKITYDNGYEMKETHRYSIKMIVE